MYIPNSGRFVLGTGLQSFFGRCRCGRDILMGNAGLLLAPFDVSIVRFDAEKSFAMRALIGNGAHLTFHCSGRRQFVGSHY